MVYKRIIVRGRVQGVYFRASTKDKAVELGLTGEVRNMEDESVEVLVAGEDQKVEQLKDLKVYSNRVHGWSGNIQNSS